MDYLDSGSQLIEDEDVLTTDWTPEEVIGRREQKQQLGQAIRPLWNGSTPYNIYVLGKTGVGKTEVVNQVAQDVQKKAEMEGIDITFLKVNAKTFNTEFQAVSALETKAADYVGNSTIGKGFSTDRIYSALFNHLDDIGGNIIVVIDEIDEMGSDGDGLLYRLSRARANGDIEDARISIIFLANDFQYERQLDNATIDEVDPDDIHFPSYDAQQLQDILQQRVELAFRNGVVEDAVVPLAAAFAANDRGNARQGIKLLRKAGHIAENEGAESVTEDHVREASEALERERVREGILGMSSQEKLVLSAAVLKEQNGELPAKRRAIYEDYEVLTRELDADALSMEAVRGHLHTLDNNGIMSFTRKNLGKEGGRRYEWELEVDADVVLEALREDNRISPVLEDRF